MIIKEDELLQHFDGAKKVILLEPEYSRKYLPLGLAKISTYLKKRNIEVVYQREYVPKGENLICVTSLFTYDSALVLRILRGIKCWNPNVKVILGGIYATLMSKKINELYPKLLIFEGNSEVLDQCVPDYSIDWKLKEPWDKFSFLFTTRKIIIDSGVCGV